ncbi:MAG: glycosyltransferase [Chloroflexota bacterium]
MRGHCLSSDAGLFYDTYDEFATSLTLLLERPRLRQTMGQNGQAYIHQNYLWDDVVQKYRHLLTMIMQNRRI